MNKRSINNLKNNEMSIQDYIDNYIHRKMKNCKLPYGMQYYSKLNSVIEAAEKSYKRKFKNT